MSETLGLASVVLAVAVLAFNSSSRLYKTIQSFQSRPRPVRVLLSELSGLTSVLQQFSEQEHFIHDVGPSALTFTLEQCRTFREWTKLKYSNGDGIEGFRMQLIGYQSTITVALDFMKLHTSSTTTETIQVYRDLVATTIVYLESHLEDIQQKLETLARHPAASTIPNAVIRQRIKGERLSTNKGLLLCATLCQQTEQLGGDQKSSTMQDPSSASRIHESEGTEVCEDPLRFTVNQLEKQRERITEDLATNPMNADSVPSEFQKTSQERRCRLLWRKIIFKGNKANITGRPRPTLIRGRP